MRRNEKNGGSRRGRLQEKIAEKNRRVKNLRARLEKKDRELAELRTQLAQARSATYAPHFSYENTPVFFIVGRAKSGTSWLMRILDAHPEILCRGEGRFFGRDFSREDFKQMKLKTIQPTSLYRAILDSEHLRLWVERSVWTRGKDVDECLRRLTRLAITHFLTERLPETGKRIVGDKTPILSAETLNEISVIYPRAKVIHMIRDGRDVAVSFVHHRWNHAKDEGGIYELEPEEIAKREAYRKNPKKLLKAGESIFTETVLRNVAVSWNDFVSKTIQDGPELLGSNYTEVRYEDLLRGPEEEVGRILRFLGADDDEETVRRCVESASFEAWTEGRQRGQEDSTAFLRKGVAGDWKGVFTERDREIFKQEAGELLIELGYEKDDNW
jgi:Sulfotransferase domain